MCSVLFRKNEVFIYPWYVPSALLEVGPRCSAATVQTGFSLELKSIH